MIDEKILEKYAHLNEAEADEIDSKSRKEQLEFYKDLIDALEEEYGNYNDPFSKVFDKNGKPTGVAYSKFNLWPNKGINSSLWGRKEHKYKNYIRMSINISIIPKNICYECGEKIDSNKLFNICEECKSKEQSN